MPDIYRPQSTVYVRDLFKLEKELFERIDEAETTLHAAIVESLAPGTVRTINTSTPSGIASLSELHSCSCPVANSDVATPVNIMS